MNNREMFNRCFGKPGRFLWFTPTERGTASKPCAWAGKPYSWGGIRDFRGMAETNRTRAVAAITGRWNWRGKMN